jgi:hypothetical protein
MKVIAVKINRLWDEGARNGDALKEATRQAWRLNLLRANECDYIVGIVRGDIRSIYQIDKAFRVPNRNNRVVFEVSDIDADLYRYISEQIEEEVADNPFLFKAQSPIKYLEYPDFKK